MARRAPRVLVACGLAALMLCVAPSALAAEESAEHDLAILVNPIGLAFGLGNVDIGIGMTGSTSINVQLQYLSFEDATAYGGGLGMQWFPGGERFDGWFVYPQAVFARATSEDTDDVASVIGIAALGGHQWAWSLFALRLGAGIVYYASSGDGIDVSGVVPALDVSLGLVF